jgi:outer membrane biosynthesis protein TonB
MHESRAIALWAAGLGCGFIGLVYLLGDGQLLLGDGQLLKPRASPAPTPITLSPPPSAPPVALEPRPVPEPQMAAPVVRAPRPEPQPVEPKPVPEPQVAAPVARAPSPEPQPVERVAEPPPQPVAVPQPAARPEPAPRPEPVRTEVPTIRIPERVVKAEPPQPRSGSDTPAASRYSGDNPEARRYTDALNALAYEGYSGVDSITPDGPQFRAVAIMEGRRVDVLVDPENGAVRVLGRPR